MVLGGLMFCSACRILFALRQAGSLKHSEHQRVAVYTLIKALRRALAEVSAVPGQEVARPNAAGSNWQYYVFRNRGDQGLRAQG